MMKRKPKRVYIPRPDIRNVERGKRVLSEIIADSIKRDEQNQEKRGEKPQ